MEADMTTYMATRGARIGFVTVIATILIVGICGDATARTHIRHLQARSVMFESHAQLVSQPPARLGAMRYYGGPKSPMWRGSAEN
jgi:hypothetical protein